jgi:uncharacterized membrane protein
MRQRLPLCFAFVLIAGIANPGLALCQAVAEQAIAEAKALPDNSATTETLPMAESGLVDFQRDIAPILVSRCLGCHGPKDAKNDFRVDEMDSVLSFIEPGDIASSSLWTDYLRAADPDMQMPPASHGALGAGELALIQVWIQEGAVWPSDAKVASEAPSEVVVDTPNPPSSLLARVWAFQGYLHPATVHFPVALLLVGGAFVVVSWRYPLLGQNVALVCLFLGTLSSIVASMMGWSFAVRRGYGSWDRIDMDSEIFWHRWSAIIVTIVALATSAFALQWLRNRNHRTDKVWKCGLLLLAMMVGAVGHQGGELTYGKTFYKEAFDLLLGTEAAPATNGEKLESANDAAIEESAALAQ